MTTIPLSKLQSDLSALMLRVAAGETLLVMDEGKAVAEIRPADVPRPSGLCKGEFVIPDDFDAPLPDEILRDFNPQ